MRTEREEGELKSATTALNEVLVERGIVNLASHLQTNQLNSSHRFGHNIFFAFDALIQIKQLVMYLATLSTTIVNFLKIVSQQKNN